MSRTGETMGIASRIAEWPLGGNRQSALPSSLGLTVHALHKSASSFLHQFFQQLTGTLGCRLYSINNDPPDHHEIPREIDQSFVLCPVRSFCLDRLEFPNMKQMHHLLQVRDPRDILVSEYFSFGWLHSDRDWAEEDLSRREHVRQLNIDEYVRREPELAKVPLGARLAGLNSVVGRGNVTVVRYETMVEDFASWLQPVLMAVGLGADRRLKAKLVRKYRNEFQPGGVGSHKRRVTPGDHLRQLRPESIELLNERFAETLALLGYPHKAG